MASGAAGTPTHDASCHYAKSYPEVTASIEYHLTQAV